MEFVLVQPKNKLVCRCPGVHNMDIYKKDTVIHQYTAKEAVEAGWTFTTDLKWNKESGKALWVCPHCYYKEL